MKSCGGCLYRGARLADAARAVMRRDGASAATAIAAAARSARSDIRALAARVAATARQIGGGK